MCKHSSHLANNTPPPEKQTRCLSGLTEALLVKNKNNCSWQNNSWSCNLSQSSLWCISVPEITGLYLYWVQMELAGKSLGPAALALPTCPPGRLLWVSEGFLERNNSLGCCSRFTTGNASRGQGAHPGQPRFSLPSWLIQYVFDLGVLAGGREHWNSSISVLHWFSQWSPSMQKFPLG